MIEFENKGNTPLKELAPTPTIAICKIQTQKGMSRVYIPTFIKNTLQITPLNKDIYISYSKKHTYLHNRPLTNEEKEELCILNTTHRRATITRRDNRVFVNLKKEILIRFSEATHVSINTTYIEDLYELKFYKT